MIIKRTQKKGLSISNKTGEAILEADHVTIVRRGSENGTSGTEFVISSPGEYEVEQISVTALDPYPAFIIDLEGFTIAYLPSPPPELNSESQGLYGQADIIILPGNHYAIAEELAPSLIIPIDQIEQMAKDAETEVPEAQKTLALKRIEELPDETEIVNLG